MIRSLLCNSRLLNSNEFKQKSYPATSKQLISQSIESRKTQFNQNPIKVKYSSRYRRFVRNRARLEVGNIWSTTKLGQRVGGCPGSKG